ncbi:methyltransferase domain-containing protein [Streptomyces telluris]|uniref:Methyltransferase domain-containing protein n=1 Tax=Streptomyces telluris TaxID=2720021 RepID=A0A9X2LIV1_9ACTN|nr:methyltransferase domain-containing protein [Streptomyces telluris]MCQ8771637.1 methyltransferase domain-containing protein [Streptomyces telluris]
MAGRRARPDRGALRGPARHTFDIARHGYAGLLTGTRATSGDDAAMVRARDRFLATGKYGPIRRAVARPAAGAVPAQGTVVDVGCGTGYYLAGLLDQLPGARGLGLDASVRALRSAARVHERAAAATWDVLEQRLHQAPAPFFEATRTGQVEYVTSLTRPEALDLIGMTPSARHLSPAGLDGTGFLPDQVTVSVPATTYQPASVDSKTINRSRSTTLDNCSCT